MSSCCANCYYVYSTRVSYCPVYSTRFAYCPDCGSEKRIPPPASDASENDKANGRTALTDQGRAGEGRSDG